MIMVCFFMLLCRLRKTIPVRVVEALVARETLSLQHVILETIALLLIDAISSPTMDCLYFCLIV